MRSRALPVLLLAAAMLADASGLHDATFYLLLAAVPPAALCALALYGELVEVPGRWGLRIHTFVAALALLLVVVAAASHEQAPEAALAGSAAVAALALYGAQTFATLARR